MIYYAKGEQILLHLDGGRRVLARAGEDWFVANQTGRYKAIVAGGRASYDYVVDGPYTRDKAKEMARKANKGGTTLRRSHA